jgi:hypothetical protein
LNRAGYQTLISASIMLSGINNTIFETGGGTMNTCQVLDPKQARGVDHVGTLDFSGNKPALPPLTTEAVTSIIYLVDDESKN